MLACNGAALLAPWLTLRAKSSSVSQCAGMATMQHSRPMSLEPGFRTNRGAGSGTGRMAAEEGRSGPERRACYRSVRGSPKRGNALLSANHVIAETRSSGDRLPRTLPSCV